MRGRTREMRCATCGRRGAALALHQQAARGQEHQQGVRARTTITATTERRCNPRCNLKSSGQNWRDTKIETRGPNLTQSSDRTSILLRYSLHVLFLFGRCDVCIISLSHGNVRAAHSAAIESHGSLHSLDRISSGFRRTVRPLLSAQDRGEGEV